MSTNDQQYTQCKLRKKIFADKVKLQIAWIPQSFAKVGKVLAIEEDDGWEVLEVYNTVDCGTANLKARDWVKQRKASDI